MATSKLDPRMAFHAEQHDPGAPQKRELILFFFYEDSTVEMMLRSNGRLFLRRTHTDIPASSFVIDSVVMMFGKATRITAYADEVTRQLCSQQSESTTLIIAEESFPLLGRYLAILTEECGFAITDVELAWIKQDAVSKYHLPAELASTRAVFVIVSRTGALEKGFDFVERARGTCTAADAEQAQLWAELAGVSKMKPLAVQNELNSSVVVLKPHLIAKGYGGAVMQALIDLNLEPTGLTCRTISSAVAHHFLEPYRGVLRNVEGTADSFVGKAWILQLISVDSSLGVVEAVRQACGPYDTVIAKKLFPKCIRACYGESETNNAVHCCDLEVDGPIYTKFFFGS